MTIEEFFPIFFLLAVANVLCCFLQIRVISMIYNTRELLKLKDGEKK